MVNLNVLFLHLMDYINFTFDTIDHLDGKPTN